MSYERIKEIDKKLKKFEKDLNSTNNFMIRAYIFSETDKLVCEKTKLEQEVQDEPSFIEKQTNRIKKRFRLDD